MRLREHSRDLHRFLVFNERFASPSSLASNLATVTGTPAIGNGFTAGADNRDRVQFVRNFLRGTFQRMSVDVDVTTPSDINSVTFLFGDYTGSALSFLVMFDANRVRAFFGSTSVFGSVSLSPSTRYRLTFTYDGTQAVANDRMKCYVNGVPTALAVTGTIPTTAGPSSADAVLLGQTGANFGMAGTKVWSASLYSVTLTPEEALDLYQQDAFSELDMRKASLHLPLKSWAYAGNTELLADGSMEAADTSAYSSYNSSTLSKETGTRTGGTGTKVLRVTKAGALGGAVPYTLTVGKRYRVTGWVRSDGTAVPSVVNVSFNDIYATPASTSWVYFDRSFTASSTLFILGKNAGGTYVEWDDVTLYELPATTPDLGTLSPAAKLGDGYTSTTFPTLRVPKGMTFDGGDWIEAGTVDPFTKDQPFSVAIGYNGFPDTSASRAFIGTREVNTGWCLRYQAALGIQFILTQDASNFFNIFKSDASGTIFHPGFHTLIATYSGANLSAGMNIYVDGERIACTQSNIGTVTSIASGRRICVGAQWNGAGMTAQITGMALFSPTVFPFELTPYQAAALHRRIMKEANTTL